MASTCDLGCEIRKFDAKDFSLWNEMMQDELIIICEIKAIGHKKGIRHQ
mgnify:CR=1 FL=1